MSHERLSPLDTSFLYLETPGTPMHIASLTVYEGGPAPTEALIENLANRLHLVPRFRQKLGVVPLNQHRPVWVDDVRFDLGFHVHHVALPAPGSDVQLKRQVGDLLSTHLDRTRPLWEMWIIDGLRDGRFALLSKTHHSMWDGLAGADLHAVLLDTTPEPQEIEPEPWEPRPAHTVDLLVDGIRDRADEATSIVRSAWRAVREPGRVLRSGAEIAKATTAFARAGLVPAPPSPLNVPIGPQRRYETAEVSMGDVKRVREAFGGTVNDVVLTAVGDALSTWLTTRAASIPQMKVMVPVSVRPDGERGAVGNKVSLLIAPIPTDEREPLDRLTAVQESMSVAKTSNMTRATEMLTQLSGFAPPVALAQLQRLQSVHRAFNLLVTNIPGPPMPLYLCGKRMLGLYPQAPLAANQGLAVAVMSYEDRLCFGLLADREAVGDVAVIAHGIEDAVSELVGAAKTPDASISQADRRRAAV